MPRCLMAKKFKAYPWPDRSDEEDDKGDTTTQQDDEEIDVVGDSTEVLMKQPSTTDQQQQQQQSCWGPHSPTAGATAPSPPPLNASGALYYHGESLCFEAFAWGIYGCGCTTPRELVRTFARKPRPFLRQFFI